MFKFKVRDMSRNQEHHRFWWQMLPAVPSQKDSLAYKRLERTWRDHTRILRKKIKGTTKEKFKLIQDFYEEHYEVHLVCTLFENFSLFSPEEWVSPFMKTAGLPIVDQVVDCRWSYEWEADKDHDGKQCDVVFSYLTSSGLKGAVVIEAKALGKKLGEKEYNLDYYLANPNFDRYRENLSLIYLVDSKVKDQVERKKSRCTGLVTWQELGALQIRLARQLCVEPRIRDFVAGSIQYHFLRHGITPDRLSADYLSDEPSLVDVFKNRQVESKKQTSAERARRLWDLDL